MQKIEPYESCPLVGVIKGICAPDLLPITLIIALIFDILQVSNWKGIFLEWVTRIVGCHKLVCFLKEQFSQMLDVFKETKKHRWHVHGVLGKGIGWGNSIIDWPWIFGRLFDEPIDEGVGRGYGKMRKDWLFGGVKIFGSSRGCSFVFVWGWFFVLCLLCCVTVWGC